MRDLSSRSHPTPTSDHDGGAMNPVWKAVVAAVAVL
jgi:hypothetical protein